MEKVEEIVVKIAGLDSDLLRRTQERLDNLTKPPGSLGRLEELARMIVGMTGKANPSLDNKVIFTLAADHGAAEDGVSAYPREVTAQMVYNFLNGGAAINVLAKHAGARVVVVDLGVAVDLKPHPELMIKKINYGTKNMRQGPAMSRGEAIKSIEAGKEIFQVAAEKGIDIAGTGDMGIGNTTASAALTAVFTGRAVEDVTGRGTGLEDQALKNKVAFIAEAIGLNKPDKNDPLDVLAKLGGFEIGGLAGIILAAASRRVPVVIDGFISGTAALLAYQLEPKVKDYLIASHCSVEKGHKIILDFIGLKPFLDLNLRLGEGTGAALGISLAEASIKILTQMATFAKAGVSTKK
ncbi:MAG: nicotinate-nucleotide--dimethylbenzimidazole phosphoribosyltransferase [Elusimicrobiota bacterium]